MRVDSSVLSCVPRGCVPRAHRPRKFNAISGHCSRRASRFYPHRRRWSRRLVHDGARHRCLSSEIVTIYFVESPSSISRFNVESIMIGTPRGVLCTREILTHESRRVSTTERNISAHGENTRTRSLCVYESLPTRYFAVRCPLIADKTVTVVSRKCFFRHSTRFRKILT